MPSKGTQPSGQMTLVQSGDRTQHCQSSSRARATCMVHHVQWYMLCTAQLQGRIIHTNCTDNHSHGVVHCATPATTPVSGQLPKFHSPNKPRSSTKDWLVSDLILSRSFFRPASPAMPVTVGGGGLECWRPRTPAACLPTHPLPTAGTPAISVFQRVTVNAK